MNQTFDRATDDHLWSWARRGNPAAFGELFTRHSTVVYNYCFRLTGSWKTAADLTSVAFLEAWRRREDRTAQNDTFVPWLLGVTSDVVRNSTRAVRRHRRLLAKLPPAVLEGDARDSAAGGDDTERQMEQILRVFRRLPKPEQEVLALCVWGERTYDEAAVALGIPVGTVRSRLARARAHMRRLTESAGHKNGTTKPLPGSRPEGAHQP